MEENNNNMNVENTGSSTVERKRVSVPLIPFIVVVILGIVLFVSLLKLMVFNKSDNLKTAEPSQEITANIIVETNGLQY